MRLSQKQINRTQITLKKRRLIFLFSTEYEYIKAWNAKIVPIFLTITSTILGFIPFMVGFDKEAFWFPLAAGTIGGLVMSLIGIFFLLPVYIGIKR